MSDIQIDTTIEAGEQPAFDLPRHASVYFTGGALKAIQYGRVSGYLVVFTDATDRDSYNEYFTGRTDYGLNYYRNQPVLYHHGQKDELVTPIGVIDTLRMDNYGVYAEAQLDVNHEDPTIREYARRAYAQVNAGQLFWSSGSADHLMRITDDGEIVQWYIVEGSLTPTPAEQRGRTQVDVIRAALKALNDAHPAIEPAVAKEPDAAKKPNPQRKGKLMTTKMDSQMILAALDNVSALDSDVKLEIMRALGAIEAGEEAAESPTMADDGEVPPEAPPAMPPEPPVASARSQVNSQQIAQEILKQMRTAPAAPLPAGGGVNPAKPPANAITIRTKYHDLSPVDMAYYSELREGMARHDPHISRPSVEFYRETLDKTKKALAYEQTGSALKMAPDAANRIMAIKDNELDNTATAGQILEWIPTIWSSELWRRVRVDNEAASQFRVIEMPTDPYNLPLESTDPTVYLTPETTNASQLSLASGTAIPSSVVGSGKVQLNAKKLALRVGFSAEAEEDSIIPLIPQLREQGIRSMANAVDNVLINGDTATGASTNINDIAGTPAATDKFLIFDGLLKNALVTTAGQSVSLANATPTLANIRQLRAKLQSTLNVYGTRPDDLCMFVDVSTWFKMLSIDEINAFMLNGRDATVNKGLLPMIDGIPVFPSQEMSLANTAGKVDLDTTSNNAYGRIVMAAKQGWTIGYRRQVTTNVEYLSYYDAYQFTATLRIAFINKDGYASAAAYYINVS